MRLAEELDGATFGRLTIEAPAPLDERGVRVLCRCACGRIAVRHVVDLRAGRAIACRRCEPVVASEERKRERERRRIEKRVEARAKELAAKRPRDPERRLDERRMYQREYHARNRDRINARRRAVDAARRKARRLERPTKPCAIEGCAEHVELGRVRYCAEHGALTRHQLAELRGEPPRRLRAGDPGWDARREWSKEYRRVRREIDPEFRAREAAHARAYRERKRREREP